jgi:hypothetical protein
MAKILMSELEDNFRKAKISEVSNENFDNFRKLTLPETNTVIYHEVVNWLTSL